LQELNLYISKMNKLESCKLCSQEVKVISNSNLKMLVPDQYPLDGNIDICICQNCDFVFSRSDSSANDYLSYYRDFNKHQNRDEKNRVFDRAYFQRVCQFLSEHKTGGIEGCRVLDWGSGSLIFEEVANHFGAKSVSNFDVGGEKLKQLFDIVISTHCFEHLLDPLSSIQELTSCVVENGFVLIAVPDLSRYDQFYYGPYSHFDLEHINHFVSNSLQKLFELAGLEVVATYQGERQVQARLSYSEVVVLGRKSQKLITLSKTTHFDGVRYVGALIERYDKDLQIMKAKFVQTLENFKNSSLNSEVKICLYGLSSYAFRFLNLIDRDGLISQIEIFADSDSRLTGLTIAGGKSIIDKMTFENLSSNVTAPSRIMVLVVAINSDKIMGMFEKEFPNIPVVVLPPETLNRKI